MKTDNKKKSHKDASLRYGIIFVVMLVLGSYIMSCVLKTMFSEDREYWAAVDKRFTNDSIPLTPMRGRILASDGQVLSASIPEYWLVMDFRVGGTDTVQVKKQEAWRDSMFLDKLDSISEGLSVIFPDMTAEQFKERLMRGFGIHKYGFRVYPRRATYIQYRACKQLPLFRESAFRGGFHGDAEMRRTRPFSQLGRRTIGDIKNADSALFGLEFYYDSILRGTPGFKHRANVRNARLNFVDHEPANGNDLLTTIDIGLQDYADQTLRKHLIYQSSRDGITAEKGVAMVMEVATGDIKAIVNLGRGNDGNYYEMRNSALGDLWEPGSTFKTASILVGMDDGYIKKNDVVDCNHGTYKFSSRTMYDHNWRSPNAYGVLTVSQVLENSSNVGTSRLINAAYHDNPQKFVDGLRRAGVGIDLELNNMPGLGKPIVPQPNDTGRYWSKTDLPWMSIGYVTQLPPISTLTFYNAIANNGKMVKPRFVKAELKNGEVVREYPVEVLRESIVQHPEALANIQEFLYNVVKIGTGHKAGNKYFDASGKTGTAQMDYRNGRALRHMVSFCGYFPSQKPKYSCIVCMVTSGSGYASGGSQAGPIFSEISQYAMAYGAFRSPALAADSLSQMTPTKAAVLPQDAPMDVMPDVTGMGAQDATYELRRRGMKVVLKGRGRVSKQSIEAGSKDIKGKKVELTLG